MQQPITLVESEPRPDLAIVRDRADDYVQGHPGPGDAGLVVEVADSTVDLDRHRKARIYAGAGIAQYWIVNLPQRCVECFSSPHQKTQRREATYDQNRVVKADEELDVHLGGNLAGKVRAADLLTLKPT